MTLFVVALLFAQVSPDPLTPFMTPIVALSVKSSETRLLSLLG